MRFAFYGRVSTEDAQDPASSKAWQMRRATDLIRSANGEIVAEYFDIGQSRSLPWKRRPETALHEAAHRLENLGLIEIDVGSAQFVPPGQPTPTAQHFLATDGQRLRSAVEALDLVGAIRVEPTGTTNEPGQTVPLHVVTVDVRRDRDVVTVQGQSEHLLSALADAYVGGTDQEGLL